MNQPRKKIVFPSTSEIAKLRPYIRKIIATIAIDQPHAANAWISDRSSVGDFYLVDMEEHTAASITEKEYDIQIAMLSHRLGVGVVVEGTDLLVDIARKLSQEDEDATI